MTTDSTNPKDKIGARKPNLHLVPSVLVIHTAKAMENGAVKFGPFNWRENKVKGSIYISAALRHIHSYFDGEDRAEDSGVHHLGHAAACLGILLDAAETGNLIDDRPKAGKAAEVIKRETIPAPSDFEQAIRELKKEPDIHRIRQPAEHCSYCGASAGKKCQPGCIKAPATGAYLSPPKPAQVYKASDPAYHHGDHPCVKCGASPGSPHLCTCKAFWDYVATGGHMTIPS